MTKTDSSVFGWLLRCRHSAACTHSFKCTSLDFILRNLVLPYPAVSLKKPEDQKNPPMADDIVDTVTKKQELRTFNSMRAIPKDKKDLEHVNRLS